MDPTSRQEDSPVDLEHQQLQHQSDDLTIIRSHSQNQESNLPSKGDDHLSTFDTPVAAPVRTRLSNRLKLSSNRLLSLDLLRGLAILLMITCNAQAGDNPFFIMVHPDWIGFTIAGK